MGTKAICKDASLRPLQKLDLQENEQVDEIIAEFAGARSPEFGDN
jgi:predicted DNA-binding antitoxin AbrB/MazE fold protein